MATPRKKAVQPTIAAAKVAIREAIRGIPRGAIATYGEIAARVGLPKYARLVARVLSQSGADDVPWHRVVRAGDRIAFPRNSDGFVRQRARLQSEGHTVSANGQIVAARRASDLDQQLWGNYF